MIDFNHIQRDRLVQCLWATEDVGAFSTAEDINLRNRIVHQNLADDLSNKNFLNASLSWTDGGPWETLSWSESYISGWVQAAGFRTAGDVVYDSLANPTSHVLNEQFFLTHLGNFRTKWTSHNSKLASGSYIGFARNHGHTEQTFIFDVLENRNSPEHMPTGTIYPKKVILHLASTREACRNCQCALRGLILGNNKTRFMRHAFQNPTLNGDDIEFKIFFSHASVGKNVFIGPFDLNQFQRNTIFNITLMNSFPQGLQGGKLKDSAVLTKCKQQPSQEEEDGAKPEVVVSDSKYYGALLKKKPAVTK